MAQPTGDSRPPHHEFALALERTRREAGLKPKDLAARLFVDPRTVRRYLNGERLPTIETTESWERACNLEPGRLTQMHPAAAGTVQEPVAESASTSAPPGESAGKTRGSRARRRPVLAVAVVAVFAALGAVFLLRGNDGPHRGEAVPTGVAHHRFTKTYVGDVWIRVTPAPEQVGESHRVTLRWGPNKQEVDLRNLDSSRTLFTGKNRPDDVPLQVQVKPAATITFGEGNVPAGALDVKQGWTKAS